MSDEEKAVISYEDAITMLADGEEIHTFRSNGFALIGCSWDRAELLAAMNRCGEIQIPGDVARSMGHGLCIIDEMGPLFIETKKQAEKGEE